MGTTASSQSYKSRQVKLTEKEIIAVPRPEDGLRPNDAQLVRLFKLQHKLLSRLMESPEHTELLERYWYAMQSTTGQPGEFARISEQWKEIGATSENPADDLRAGGVLALESLVFFVIHYPGEARIMNNRSYGYPFLKAGVAITKILAEIFYLISGSGQKGSFPMEATLYWQLLQHPRSFHQLFAISFVLMDHTYCERVSRSKILQQQKCPQGMLVQIVDETKSTLLKSFSKAPTTIEELQLDMLRHNAKSLFVNLHPREIQSGAGCSEQSMHNLPTNSSSQRLPQELSLRRNAKKVLEHSVWGPNASQTGHHFEARAKLSKKLQSNKRKLFTGLRVQHTHQASVA